MCLNISSRKFWKQSLNNCSVIFLNVWVKFKLSAQEEHRLFEVERWNKTCTFIFEVTYELTYMMKIYIKLPKVNIGTQFVISYMFVFLEIVPIIQLLYVL